jgi:hypothetical protein
MSNSWAVNPKNHIDIGPQRTDVDRRDENGEIFPCPMTNSQLARPMWSALTVKAGCLHPFSNIASPAAAATAMGNLKMQDAIDQSS